MDAEIRFEHAQAHQQQLRDEAATNRLARSLLRPLGPANAGPRIPRTIGALRRLVGSMA